ncbi:MAG: hypothetical protein WB919_06595 [Candidatus Sulfotelmatobacter sp.]
MRPTYAIVAFLTLSVLTTYAQTNESSQPTSQRLSGRIVATVTNDEGEPITGQIMLCTRITQPRGESNSCSGGPSDENGNYEISQLPFGKVEVSAQAPMQGYVQEEKNRKTQTVILSSKAPVAHVVLTVGPKPGELILNVTDKATGKVVDSVFISLMGEPGGYCSGTGNFRRDTTSGVRVPISPGDESILEISAKGYKNWFYTDPSDPSHPVISLESGEERTLNVELESTVETSLRTSAAPK